MDRPFFMEGEQLPKKDLSKNYPLPSFSAPPPLVPLYRTYGHETGFVTDNGLLFLTANECQEMKMYLRFLPFAIRYLGMGWIHLFVYDEAERKVFTFHQGGSNGYDRVTNQRFMEETLYMYSERGIPLPFSDVETVAFPLWWEKYKKKLANDLSPS